jgi:hypothetical protein
MNLVQAQSRHEERHHDKELERCELLIVGNGLFPIGLGNFLVLFDVIEQIFVFDTNFWLFVLEIFFRPLEIVERLVADFTEAAPLGWVL